jgi:hypothetical protein
VVAEVGITDQAGLLAQEVQAVVVALVQRPVTEVQVIPQAYRHLKEIVVGQIAQVPLVIQEAAAAELLRPVLLVQRLLAVTEELVPHHQSQVLLLLTLEVVAVHLKHQAEAEPVEPEVAVMQPILAQQEQLTLEEAAVREVLRQGLQQAAQAALA